MDHMRISGTDPSVISCEKRIFKILKSYVPKVPKQAEAKRDCVINFKDDFTVILEKSKIGIFPKILGR